MLGAKSAVSRYALPAIAILLVLAIYFFFGSAGHLRFHSTAEFRASYYTLLAKGFTEGRLSVAQEPDAALKALSDPYEPTLREGIPYMWDASYYEGRYYLYFTPLPALLIYLPVHIATGLWPGDAFVGVLLFAIAFVIWVATVRRALRLTGSRVPFSLWILLIGLGNLMPFIIVDIRIYEIALATGCALTAAWAYSLVRFAETLSVRAALCAKMFLALAITARPSLAILLLPTAFLLIRAGVRTALIALGPLVLVGTIAAAYNYARFGSPLEFGMRYQLSGVKMATQRVCSLCTPAELTSFINNFFHYAFLPPNVLSRFPFVELQRSVLDPATSFPGREQVVGVIPIVPLTLVAVMAAALMLSRRRLADSAFALPIALVSGSWLVLLGLSTCSYVVVRYSLDFIGIMIAGSIIMIERALALIEDITDGRAIGFRVTVALLAVYSIVINLFLGFSGREQSFRLLNFQMFLRVAKLFHSDL